MPNRPCHAIGKKRTHGDESSRVRHKARVLGQPLLKVFPPGSVISGKPGAIFEVDDGDPAVGVRRRLSGALAEAWHRSRGRAHLANTAPPRRHLSTNQCLNTAQGGIR